MKITSENKEEIMFDANNGKTNWKDSDVLEQKNLNIWPLLLSQACK